MKVLITAHFYISTCWNLKLYFYLHLSQLMVKLVYCVHVFFCLSPPLPLTAVALDQVLIPFLNYCSHLTVSPTFNPSLFCSFLFYSILVLFYSFPPLPSPSSSSLSIAFYFLSFLLVPLHKFGFKDYNLSQSICSQSWFIKANLAVQI